MLVSSKLIVIKMIFTCKGTGLVNSGSNSDLTCCFYSPRWNHLTEGTCCQPNVSFRLEWFLQLCPQSAVKNQGVFILKCWDIWVKINMNVSSREVVVSLCRCGCVYLPGGRTRLKSIGTQKSLCRNVKLEGWKWKPRGGKPRLISSLTHIWAGFVCVQMHVEIMAAAEREKAKLWHLSWRQKQKEKLGLELFWDFLSSS